MKSAIEQAFWAGLADETDLAARVRRFSAAALALVRESENGTRDRRQVAELIASAWKDSVLARSASISIAASLARDYYGGAESAAEQAAVWGQMCGILQQAL